MVVLYLTPASLGYLAQFILSALISGYFILLARRPQRPQHILWLTGFFTAIAGFISLLFFESALMPTQRLYAVFLENTLLAVALVCLLQFAYRFPNLPASLRFEARLTLGLSSLYALWEAVYAIFRFIQLSAGQVLFRPNWSDYLLLLFLLWTPLAFLRPVMLLADSSKSLRMRLETREARAAATFALIFFFVAVLNVFNILRNHFLLSMALASMSLSVGILVALFAFAVTYLNYLPEMTSFMAKLVGTTLTAVLAVLGTVAWVIAPAYIKHYQPVLDDQRTLRFTPNNLGGYDITQIPLVFETDLGQKLELSEYPPNECSAALDFEFPFYRRTYHQVYVCNDGALSMGQSLPYRAYQYRYGSGVPLIAPLLIDLYPQIGPEGVFVRQEADRLIVTWDRVRGFQLTETEFTFQVVLHPGGVFEISYNGLPHTGDPSLIFQPNDDPGANVWFIGVMPGGKTWKGEPQIANLSELPLRSGPNGVAQDYLLEFRSHLNELLVPLAGLILLASLSIVSIFPLLFYFNLMKPLNVLLRGVQRLAEGDYSGHLPVRSMDEVGFLTESFNQLKAQLHDQVYNRKLIESNPFPLIVIRRQDDTILAANQAAADYLREPLNKIISIRWQEKYIDLPSYRAVLDEYRLNGVVKNKMVKLQTGAGEPRIAMINLLGIEWNGEECLVAGLADITTRSEIEDSLRQSAKRWASLYRVNEEISATLEEEHIYTAVHSAMESVMSCEDFIISLYDEEQNLEVPVYVIEKPGKRLTLPPKPADRGLAGVIMQTGQSIRLNNLAEITAREIDFAPNASGAMISSVLAVPMWLNGKPVGMISAQSYLENAYIPEDEELLEVLSTHASIALENARLFKRIRREMFERQRVAGALAHQKAMLEAINTAAKFFLAGEDWQGQLMNMLEALGKATKATRVYVYQNHENETGNLAASIIAQWSPPDTQPLAIRAGLRDLFAQKIFGRWSDLMFNRQSVIGLSREFPDEEKNIFVNLGIVSLVAVPIFVGAEWWGFVRFDDCYSEKRWTISDVDLLETSADMLGTAIHRQQVEEQLRLHQIDLAASEERERMGRDLHDGLGQVIGFINVQSQATQVLLEEGQVQAARENLVRMTRVAQESHANIRNYILGLRAPTASQRNFYSAVQTYLHEFSQTWNIETSFSLPPEGLPVLPETIEDQLLHIIQEALVNIRKHAKAHRVNVLITLLSTEMMLMVSDDGLGFDPSTAPGAAGGHFGLSIMHERAEQIGGRLEIRSEPGRGTQLLIMIPQMLPSKSQGETVDIHSLRILLVDDQPLFLDGLYNLFKARGLTVIGLAHDGLEAQEQVRALRPDVVIMDVQMPNCDGIEATRHIKTEFPEVKVVLLTISEDHQYLLDAIRSGASGYLLKSLDANEIFSMLAGIMRGEMQIAPRLAPQFLAEFTRSEPHPSDEAAEMDNFVPAGLNIRQWDVLRLVTSGLTYKEVGSALHLTERAVKYHMAQIVERLNLADRDQAVGYAQDFQEARKKKTGGA